MSTKRQRKAQRRVPRKRKTASRTKAPQHAEVGASARALPHPDPVKLSDLFAIRAPNDRGPGEELPTITVPATTDGSWYLARAIRSSFRSRVSWNLAGGCWPSRIQPAHP